MENTFFEHHALSWLMAWTVDISLCEVNFADGFRIVLARRFIWCDNCLV